MRPNTNVVFRNPFGFVPRLRPDILIFSRCALRYLERVVFLSFHDRLVPLSSHPTREAASQVLLMKTNQKHPNSVTHIVLIVAVTALIALSIVNASKTNFSIDSAPVKIRMESTR